ncbi:MAG TPA: hypothetical protein VIL74_05660 [Pyrinomonadaceae bacterium]|jgi:hypothetical protein
MKTFAKILFLIIALTFSASAQKTETLTNAVVVEMTKIGLDKEIILKKINDSRAAFDVSASALIELKKEGVADEVIALMLEKNQAAPEIESSNREPAPANYSETISTLEVKQFAPLTFDPKEALRNAKTVAIEKSSLNPSRQGLEKALFKRKDWQKYKLTLIRYKQDADLYIEIGRVPFSWLTHRYVFRLYDRRSGTIITAGETTSWGSLAENLAREITQKMNLVAGN